jgi:hypothetical protein
MQLLPMQLMPLQLMPLSMAWLTMQCRHRTMTQHHSHHHHQQQMMTPCYLPATIPLSLPRHHRLSLTIRTMATPMTMASFKQMLKSQKVTANQLQSTMQHACTCMSLATCWPSPTTCKCRHIDNDKARHRHNDCNYIQARSMVTTLTVAAEEPWCEPEDLEYAGDDSEPEDGMFGACC